MVRPEIWTGASSVRVIAGEPGSKPRFVAERRWAERGVESLFGVQDSRLVALGPERSFVRDATGARAAPVTTVKAGRLSLTD